MLKSIGQDKLYGFVGFGNDCSMSAGKNIMPFTLGRSCVEYD